MQLVTKANREGQHPIGGMPKNPILFAPISFNFDIEENVRLTPPPPLNTCDLVECKSMETVEIMKMLVGECKSFMKPR